MASNKMNIILFLLLIKNGLDPQGTPFGGTRPLAPPAEAPRPGIILLDLNMPRMDGREALKTIRSDPRFRSIRVVVMTTSKAEADIVRSYDLSAASYITKPVTFDGLVEVVRSLGRYWLEIVELAPEGDTP